MSLRRLVRHTARVGEAAMAMKSSTPIDGTMFCMAAWQFIQSGDAAARCTIGVGFVAALQQRACNSSRGVEHWTITGANGSMVR